MSDRLKLSNAGLYIETDWKTGDIITQGRMMNIEDWLASATDELMEARTGYTVLREINTWKDLHTRLEYLTNVLSVVTPDGAAALVGQLT